MAGIRGLMAVIYGLVAVSVAWWPSSATCLAWLGLVAVSAACLAVSAAWLAWLGPVAVICDQSGCQHGLAAGWPELVATHSHVVAGSSHLLAQCLGQLAHRPHLAAGGESGNHLATSGGQLTAPCDP